MGWTKDSTTLAPKAIYTPGTGDTNPSVKRVIFDPEAPTGEQFVAIMSGVHEENQTQASFEQIIGVGG